MTPAELDILKTYARYIWWKTPEEAMLYPRRLITQVMNLGTQEDSLALLKTLGEETFRKAIRKAEIGEFDENKWHYWHCRLGLTVGGEVPPMPLRKLE